MKKKFFDRITLFVESGKGGDGSRSFRREKYVPKGGPDGGDGGNGGDIIITAKKALSDFSHLARKRSLKAENGANGSKRKKTGEHGKSFRIAVPIGTIVKTKEGVVLHEFLKEGMEFVALRGGTGGKGNVHYKTSTNQAPSKFQLGSLGRTAELQLELLTIAQVALIGAPNAGKSTLLRKITASLGKVASYPFTTLAPELGMYHFPSNHLPALTLAEIPGIVEGAHRGIGLGHHFLRHARRTAFFLYLVDSSQSNPFQSFENLCRELFTYDKQLLEKPSLILLTKAELVSTERLQELLSTFENNGHIKKCLAVSSHTEMGLKALAKRLEEIAKTPPDKNEETKKYQQLDDLLKRY